MKKKTLLPRSNTTKCVRRGEGKGGTEGERQRETQRERKGGREGERICHLGSSTGPCFRSQE